MKYNYVSLLKDSFKKIDINADFILQTSFNSAYIKNIVEAFNCKLKTEDFYEIQYFSHRSYYHII